MATSGTPESVIRDIVDAMRALSLPFVWALVRETRGKTLEQM
jgi:hypothetical protein